MQRLAMSVRRKMSDLAQTVDGAREYWQKRGCSEVNSATFDGRQLFRTRGLSSGLWRVCRSGTTA